MAIKPQKRGTFGKNRKGGGQGQAITQSPEENNHQVGLTELLDLISRGHQSKRPGIELVESRKWKLVSVGTKF